MTEILRAAAVTKTYGADADRGTAALRGVDLVVDRGESVAIMGASGSGKTTLLHCLAGIATPDSGTVTLQGPDGPLTVSALSDAERSRLRRTRFGFVFQEGMLIPELTAVENVALALLVTDVGRSEAERLAASWLADLGLAGLEQRRIGQLSGGQAQRVAIARALVTGAPVIFADEPTGALDSRTSAEVMDALLRTVEVHGRTLVIVTHDAAVAARCSRTVRMRDGATDTEAASGGPATLADAATTTEAQP